jgi:putative SOS response-associated peptidase YedK
MCGRFSLDRSAEILEARFKAKLRISGYQPLYNIGPGMPAAVIPMDDPEGISLYPWGLAEQSRDGKARNLINARCETFYQKWPFKGISGKGRCLIPASGYIEWKLIGGKKIPFLLQLQSKEVFSMAGLFEESGGHRRFTILTRPAGPLAAEIHDRMPVILKAEEEQAWLNPKGNPEEFSREFLESAEPALAFFSLSPKLNASFENNPELLKPTPYSVPEQLKLF